MEIIRDFLIKDIVISEDYIQTPPKPEKLEWAEQRYLQEGTLPVSIIINDSDVLIDGYITYLLAVRYGIEQINVYRGCLELVEAVHYSGSTKTYMWRIPSWLSGQIDVNDYIIVPSSRGVKRVKVVKVMQEQYPCQSRFLKRVYKKCKPKQGTDSDSLKAG